MSAQDRHNDAAGERRGATRAFATRVGRSDELLQPARESATSPRSSLTAQRTDGCLTQRRASRDKRLAQAHDVTDDRRRLRR
jgi:hypothetical protein